MTTSLETISFDDLDAVSGGANGDPTLSQPASQDSTANDLVHAGRTLGGMLRNPVSGISSGATRAWNNTTKSREAGDSYLTQAASSFAGFFGFER